MFKLSLRVALLGASMFSSCALHAQAGGAASEAEPQAPDVGEIIVTAQKRAERLNDVPVSITAASGEMLAQRGITSPADLEKIAPGFTYRLSQYGTPIFSIRGIGFYDEQLAVSPTVTVYVDQAPIPYARMTEGAALDVERVEVLKGPQGTLFGQNATGGAVNYIPAKPGNKLEAGVDLSYGRFNEAQVGGFISTPLTDTLGIRVSGRYESRGNWQRSVTRDDGIGKRDFLVGRAILEWNASDRLKVELNVNGWRNKSDMQIAQARGYLPVNPAAPSTPVTIANAAALGNYRYVNGDRNRAADWDADKDFQRDDSFYQIAGRVAYELTDALSLVSISSYSHLKVYSPIDTDATNVFDHVIYQTGRVSSFSEELRLEGELSDRLRFVVGGNYQKDRTREFQHVLLRGSNAELAGVFFDTLNETNNQNIRDLAGFASLEYKLTDQLTLQGAVRYTDEDRDFSGCLADGGGPQGFRVALAAIGLNIGENQCITLGSTGVPGLYEASLDQNNTSWRGNISWKPNADTLLYANVTKGYKAGTFGTLPAVSAAQYKPVTQESVVAYEAGFKLSMADRKVDLSGAAFYYDYSDKQIQGFVLVPPFGNLPALVNIPKSRLAGAELNLAVRPVNGLRLTAAATYLSSKVRGSAILPTPFGNPVDVKGEAFPATPKWQLQGDAEYNFPVSSSVSGFVGASGTWRSATAAQFGADGGPAGTEDYFKVKAYGLVDLRAGVEIDERYRVQVYGRNVTNTQYWNNVTHIYDTYDRVTGMPATYGIMLSARL